MSNSGKNAYPFRKKNLKFDPAMGLLWAASMTSKLQHRNSSGHFKLRKCGRNIE